MISSRIKNFNSGLKQETNKALTENEKNHDNEIQATPSGQFFDSDKPFFSLELAKRHDMATRIQKVQYSSDRTINDIITPENVCPCCWSIANEESKISLIGDSSKDLSHLGPAYPLLFQFLRYIIGFMTILVLITGVYNLTENDMGERCQKIDEKEAEDSERDCDVNFVTKMATSNRDDDYTDQYSGILNLITVIFLIAFTIYYRYRQKKVEIAMESDLVQIQDYTLLVENIPKDKTTKEIIEFFNQSLPNVKVSKVTMVFKIRDFIQMNNKAFSIQKMEEKQELIEKIQSYQQSCENEENLKNNFTGYVFVSFSKEEEANRIYNHFKQNSFREFLSLSNSDPSKRFSKQTLKMNRTQNPEDIIWENIEISRISKFFRRLFTLTIMLSLQVGAFWALFGLNILQHELRISQQDSKDAQVITVLSSVLVIVINTILNMAVEAFANFECHTTITEKVVTLAKNQGTIMFLNTTIVQLIANILTNGYNIWVVGGLVQNITSTMFSNAIIPPIIKMLNFEKIGKIVQQKLFLMKKPEKQQQMTQKQVNLLFQRPTLNLSASYAEIANTLLLTTFYGWITPLGIPLCILFLILNSASLKFNLISSQSKPSPLGTYLSEEMLKFYFSFFVFSFAAGCLTFEWILYVDFEPITIVTASIAGVFFLFPRGIFFDRFTKFDQIKKDETTFEEAKLRGYFSSDYDLSNPVFKQKASKVFADFIIDNAKDPMHKEAFKQLFFHSESLQLKGINDIQPHLEEAKEKKKNLQKITPI